jgi:sugar lactone lactonase YvrE
VSASVGAAPAQAAHGPGAAERRVEVAVALPCELGESPVWHPREQVLYWCDIAGRRLYRFDPARRDLAHWDFDSEPACVAPALDGTLLLAMRDGLWRFDPAQARRTRLSAPPYDPTIQRFNDGRCDALGRLWIGTIHEPRDRPAAALYRLAGGALDRAAGEVTVANGLAFSPDARTLYWADTKAHRITAFDFDLADGTLARPREFARFAPRAEGAPLSTYGGRPDGAAVDSLGRYWVAMYEGSRVVCLSPAGEVVDEIALPVRCPTMPCFGGPDLRTLYLTTARHGRPAAELADQPLAGCVLAVRLEVPGLPASLAHPERLAPAG